MMSNTQSPFRSSLRAFLAVFTLAALTTSAFGANWSENFEASVKKAREAEKPLLILFTGSDWCPPCMQLEQRIFSTETFSKFANEHLVLMKADFPRAPQEDVIKEQNQALQRQFQIQGYPTVFVVDPSSGDVHLAQSGFGGQSPQEYVDEIKNAIRKD